ncbi:MAG: autotransporter domain-containing protein [Rhizobiales bacterium]|nr:autotransporter domain-containing protein [Hyphomicrobiales bacterium]
MRASTAMTGGVIAAMLVFQPAPAQAQGTNTWIGTDGNWNNTANWSLGTVPYQGDDVVISTFTNNPPAPVFQAFSKSVTINLPLAGIPQGGNVAADTVTFNRGAGNSGLAQWLVTNRFELQSGRFELNSDNITPKHNVALGATDFLIGTEGVFNNRGSMTASKSPHDGDGLTNFGAFFNNSGASIRGVVVNRAGFAAADGSVGEPIFGPQADRRQFYNAGSISGGVLRTGQMPIFAVNNDGYFWNVALAGQIYGGVQNAGGYFRNEYIVKGDIFVSGGTFVNGSYFDAQQDFQGIIDNGIVNGQPVASKLTVGPGGTFINRRGDIRIAVDNQGTFTNYDGISANVVSSGTFNSVAAPDGSLGGGAPTITGTLDVNGGTFTNKGTIYGLVTVNAGTFANEGNVNGINVAAGGVATNSGTTSQALSSPGGAPAAINVSGQFRNLSGGRIGTQDFIQYAFNDRPTFVSVTAGGAFLNEAGGIVRSSVFSQGKTTGNALNGNFGTIQGDLTVNGGEFIQSGTLEGSAKVDATATLIFGGRLNGVNSDGNLAANLRIGLSTFSNDGAVVFDGQSRDTVVLGRIFGTGTVENRGGGLSGGVTFHAEQTYTGKTMVTGGFLAFNKGYGSTVFEVSGGASIVFNNAANTFFSGAVTGAGNFIKGGSGTMTVDSVLANTGAVAVSGGTLQFGANGGMATTAVLETQQTGTANLGAGNRTVGGLRGQSGEISGTGQITINSAANTVSQYSGVISGAGRTVIKSGAGTQEFYGANTYSGGTTISGGVLKVGSSAALGTGGVTVEAGANLELGTIGNQAGADFTFDKVVTGAGGLIKTNSNTVTLTGVNTYTGDTYVREGTLRLGGTGKIALASKIVVSSGAKFDIGNTSFETNTLTNLGGDLVGGGGTLTLNFTTPETYRGTISDGVGQGDTFRLALTGGTLTLSGNNSFTGGIVISGHGTKLILDHNNAAGGINNKIYTQGTVITYNNGVNNAAGIVISSNTTQLEVNGTDSAQQSGIISEDQAGRPLEKIGIGTLILGNGMANPQNTFSGAFTLSAGTVAIQSTRNLGSDTATNRLIFNGGTLDTGNNVIGMSRPFTVNAAGGTVNHAQALIFQGDGNVFTGRLAKRGAGVLVLTGTSTGAGGILVDEGTLSLGANSSAGTGTITMNGGTRLRGRTDGMNIANNIAIQGKGGITLEREFAGVNYTLSGNISGNSTGSSLQKTQDGTINLTGNNTFQGGVTLSAGTLGVGSNTALGTGALSAQIGTTLKAFGNVSLANPIVITQGMAATNQFTVDTNGFNMTLSGVISTNVPTTELAQPGLTKNGAGNLTLTGTNTYRGATIVNAGTLIVNGSIANTSSVTIANGAKLGGNAAIPNLTVQSGATLSPGNSIGTTNIAGNLTLNAGSTTVIEIQQSQSDRVVVGGTAQINGTLQLVALGGPYVFSSPYTIITSGGARTGTFTTVTTDSAFGVGVTSTVSYGANNVQVVLNPLQSISPLLPSPRNVLAVASGMDRAVAAGANPSAFFNIYNLPTRDALAAAVNTLSGEVHTSVNAIGVQASDQFMRVMLDPTNIGRNGGLAAGAMSQGKINIWGAAFSQTGRNSGEPGTIGSSRRSVSDWNMAFGADMRVHDSTILGLAVAGGQATSSTANNLGTAKANVFQVGLSSMSRFGNVSVNLAGSYSLIDADTDRVVPTLSGSNIKASYQAHVWSGRAEAAYTALRVANISVSPFVAVQAQGVRTPGFVEKVNGGVAAFSVAASGNTNATVRSELGFRIDLASFGANDQVSLFARAAWAHYFTRDSAFSGSLSGLAGSAYTVRGARPANDSALLGLGADVKIGPSMTFGGTLNSELSARQRTFGGSAKFRMAF